MSYQEGKEFAESLGMQFLETSAKDKINIEESFITLTKAILPTVPENKAADNGGASIGQVRTPKDKKKGGCC